MYQKVGRLYEATYKKADANTLNFELASKGDVDPAKDPHMHALTITFSDKNSMTQKGVMFENGKEKDATTLKLVRVQP